MPVPVPVPVPVATLASSKSMEESRTSACWRTASGTAAVDSSSSQWDTADSAPVSSGVVGLVFVGLFW